MIGKFVNAYSSCLASCSLDAVESFYSVPLVVSDNDNYRKVRFKKELRGLIKSELSSLAEKTKFEKIDYQIIYESRLSSNYYIFEVEWCFHLKETDERVTQTNVYSVKFSGNTWKIVSVDIGGGYMKV